jgi:hypothetical protein
MHANRSGVSKLLLSGVDLHRKKISTKRFHNVEFPKTIESILGSVFAKIENSLSGPDTSKITIDASFDQFSVFDPPRSKTFWRDRICPEFVTDTSFDQFSVQFKTEYFSTGIESGRHTSTLVIDAPSDQFSAFGPIEVLNGD